MQVGNYRPVAILPTKSKIFELVLCDQIAAYFRNIFHDRLAAFRPGFGCEHVLMRLVEDWRKALYKGQLVGAMLMDLSKAFDAMPHDLLVAKLKAYGWSDKSVLLIGDYLSNHKNSHVKDICSKASRQINVLYRLANVLDEESRLCILKCFILCHFNYCPLIWHFCGAKNTLKLEKLQIRGLRFVYQIFDCTTDSLLEQFTYRDSENSL